MCHSWIFFQNSHKPSFVHPIYELNWERTVGGLVIEKSDCNCIQKVKLLTSEFLLISFWKKKEKERKNGRTKERKNERKGKKRKEKRVIFERSIAYLCCKSYTDGLLIIYEMAQELPASGRSRAQYHTHSEETWRTMSSTFRKTASSPSTITECDSDWYFHSSRLGLPTQLEP